MNTSSPYLIKVSRKSNTEQVSAETLQAVHKMFKKAGIENITIDEAWIKHGKDIQHRDDITTGA